jgi:hypothetical protein
MAINQLTTANTFQEWLSATQNLIAVANNLTDNTNGGFVSNASIFIEGTNASLNVRTLANINTLQANTLNLTGNTGTINVTSNVYVGKDLFVYGNVNVSGNITLDAIGFDDLEVAGSANIGQTLRANVANITTANITTLVGTANTAIYAQLSGADGRALAFAIALG